MLTTTATAAGGSNVNIWPARRGDIEAATIAASKLDFAPGALASPAAAAAGECSPISVDESEGWSAGCEASPVLPVEARYGADLSAKLARLRVCCIGDGSAALCGDAVAARPAPRNDAFEELDANKRPAVGVRLPGEPGDSGGAGTLPTLTMLPRLPCAGDEIGTEPRIAVRLPICEVSTVFVTLVPLCSYSETKLRNSSSTSACETMSSEK